MTTSVCLGDPAAGFQRQSQEGPVDEHEGGAVQGAHQVIAHHLPHHRLIVQRVSPHTRLTHDPREVQETCCMTLENSAHNALRPLSSRIASSKTKRSRTRNPCGFTSIVFGISRAALLPNVNIGEGSREQQSIAPMWFNRSFRGWSASSVSDQRISSLV